MMVRVLRTIGFDVSFRAGHGQYLFDRKGDRYLDLLSGWGVFAVGRNHPVLRDALKSVLAGDLSNLVQMDVSVLAGLLAERLLPFVPYLDKVFFANSGTEAVEAAIKFVRCATGRPGIVYCDHAFHGLSYGSLSLNGDATFRDGFGPLLPGCTEVPFNDLAALEQALAGREVAAFIVEPIQGKGVEMADDLYLRGAQALCRKYGTLFVADEIQTGLGRTGKFFAVEHYGVEPEWCCSPRRCRAVTCRLAPCSCAGRSSKKCSTAWTARWCMDRPSRRTISPWRRGSRPWRSSKPRA